MGLEPGWWWAIDRDGKLTIIYISHTYGGLAATQYGNNPQFQLNDMVQPDGGRPGWKILERIEVPAHVKAQEMKRRP